MTEYVTPNIHTVLKKYQTSAPKSLQGPGHSLHTSSNSSNANASTATASSAPANNQTNNQTSPVQASAQQLNANCPCPLDVSLNNNGSSASSGSVATSLVSDIHGGLVAMRNSPCDLINKTAAHCPATNVGNSSSIINPAIATSAQQQQPSSSNVSMASNCVAGVNINPALPLIKKEIMSSPEPPTAPQTNAASNSSVSNSVGHHLNANTNTNTNSHDLPVDTNPANILPPQPPSIKIMPPPPPEVSQPILSAADSGSGELFETRLEGKTIGCFSLGGEMRLCLPQFLNNVLAEFSLEQINRSFDDLGIFCSQCTPDQLMEFKAAKILPSDVKSSGLITRTDAERLCAILLHRSDRNSYINVEDIPKGAISFKVYHRCFGKCEGICTPDMYSYQKPTCIMCLECKGWFSPQKFVGHVHRKVENRTCHWGFDSRNWHDYLHVALDVENREKYQKILDELKEVEIKEQLKAQHEINYLKRKAEMHMDHSILVPSMGLGPPPPPHQPLPPSVVKHRGEQLDIPTSKKAKSLDEPSQYQLEYQHYQSLMYAHCAQQRMAAAGQMSAFRPWPHKQTFIHAAYNAAAVAALSTLPYLSQEPPVLQNPERVVRSTDRERFERTYQPNVALAPRKTLLTQEREKEQRELRERERIEREREREIERIRERERSREREREREFEREREREMREREIQKKLQQHQQQQIKQQPVTGMCEGEIQIKQERAPTPCEMSSTPPPLSNHSDEERRSCNGPQMESDDPTTPLVSPLALSRNKNLPSTHLNHMEMQTRRLSLQNCNSSAASTASSSSSSATSTTPTNLTSANTSPQLPQPLIPAQKIQPQLHHHHAHTLPHHHHHHHPPPQQPAPHHLQRIPIHHGTSGHGHGPQAYIRQSPSPHAIHCNSATCQNPRSPEEFGGSNEITSSTSPLPQQHQQQQHNAQTIIATVNQHNKLLPSCGSSYGANSSSGSSNSNSSSSSQQQQQQHHQQHNNNEMTGRIRISKNLINQSNIMRTPTPPPPPASHPLNHQHLPHNHHQQPQVGLQSQQSVTTAAQSHQQQQQQQQQYDYFKQTQRYYQQQQQQQHQQRNHTPQPQATNLNNRHHHQQQQQQQQQLHSPSQSSSAANTPTGLNLTTNLSAASNAAATSGSSTNVAATTSTVNLQNHDKPHTHLRTPQAFMNQHQHPHPLHLPNGRGAMNSEFELSTDTDDESVNDGEADSSNTLAPWELAIETLRDSRPKERERLLNMLQRILNENQHYRLQNQQLKELIEVRNEQIAKLQAELQHCQRQLETLQISPMPAAATSLGNVSVGNINGNGLITKALRKECDDHMMLRVPLKKSQRREPEMYEQEFREKTQKESDEEKAQRQCEERIQYNLTQIKRELSESMDEDEGEEEEGGRLLDENSQPNVESSTQCEQAQPSRRRHLTNNDTATSESEAEDEDDGDDQRMSSTQNQNRSHNGSGDNNNADDDDVDDEVDEEKIKTKNQKDTPDTHPPMTEESEHEGHTKAVGYGNGDGDEDDEEADEDEVDNDDAEDDEDEEDDDDHELHNNHKRVQAPHTNAVSTPPTATTPLSPDSAATAGQLFDSSNSSDESSMKKAQMSASHALAKMNSETNDGDDDDDDDDGDDDNEEDINNIHNSNNSNINKEGRRRQHQQQQQHQLSVNGQSDNEDTQSQSGHSNNDNSEAEEEQEQEHIHKSTRNFRVNKVTSSATAADGTVTASGRSISSIDNINTSINQTTTPPNTTTVVLATKASKKLTPTTNNDIKIKQEYL